MNLAESQAPEWSSKYPRIPESQQKMGSQPFLGQADLDQCGTLTKEDEAVCHLSSHVAWILTVDIPGL